MRACDQCGDRGSDLTKLDDGDFICPACQDEMDNTAEEENSWFSEVWNGDRE